MPKNIEFELMGKFDNLKEFNSFKLNISDFANDHTKYSSCKMCKKSSGHKMKVQYGHCTNKLCLGETPCGRRYMTKTCLKNNANEDDRRNQKRWFYKYGAHNSSHMIKKQRGLSDAVKELVEEIITEYDCKPKKIHLKLSKKKYKSKVDTMPTLEQIQSYIKNRRKEIGDNNNIEKLKAYLGDFNYEAGVTPNDELFTFGVELADGSDDNHFHLGFTSLTLIKQIDTFQNRGCYHIDATYKILKYGYPLIVFGFSDIQGQFFPTAFMFTSHEETSDYNHFFESFLDLCDRFNIDFKPKFIPELYKNIMKDINNLHKSKCDSSFKLSLKMTLSKWKKYKKIDEFHDYFKKQWVESRHNKWQIHLTPPGYAHTNNPVETYNNVIKTHFVNRIKFHMQPAIEKFKEIITYESNRREKQVIMEPKVSKFIRNQAEQIKLEQKLVLNGGKYNYVHIDGSIAVIDTRLKTCTCDRFLDKAICKHLAAACLMDNINLKGLKTQSSNLIIRRRRGKRKQLNDSISEISDNELTQKETQVQQDNNANEPVKQKRGRPRLAEKALQFENNNFQKPAAKISKAKVIQQQKTKNSFR